MDDPFLLIPWSKLTPIDNNNTETVIDMILWCKMVTLVDSYQIILTDFVHVWTEKIDSSLIKDKIKVNQ